ncbi:MAG: hypothetical protein MJE68_11055, partial [Proteobacteria bacterium]|nr:hypothetical protein [Pseudomonadota bacterium]
WHYIKFGDLAIGAEIAKLNARKRFFAPSQYIRPTHRKKIAKFKTANIIFVGGSMAKIARLNARQYFRVYGNNIIFIRHEEQ